jgi:hypothetical protein
MPRRLALLIALTGVLAGALPAGAQAAPVVAVGDQKATMFGDPNFQRLGIRHARLVVAWDAMGSEWQRAEVDEWLTLARQAGIEPLVTFHHSRLGPEKRRELPSPEAFRREFLRFRAAYPWVRVYSPWNEANHCSQPTCKRPDRAAQYYNVVRAHCRGCRIVAADVLDQPNMVRWLKVFRRHARGNPRLWGLHNYIDANRFGTRGTRAFLRAVPGEVWFTETGGLVRRQNGSSISFPNSPAHAARATTWLFRRLAPMSPRIRRIYLYHWSEGRPESSWDSGLVDRAGRVRPAYAIVRRELERQAAARRAAGRRSAGPRSTAGR